MLSVIIRNRNEACYLRSVLLALSKQDMRHEIILVDNNSTDDSREIASVYDAKILTIDDFTYGKALNIGLEAATGEICVILSAHSLPLGTSFLSECAKPFVDERVAAARCVYAGKAADALRWLEPEVLGSSSDFVSKGILASGCVIRRSAWQKVKFDEQASAAEEKLWTGEIIRMGYEVVSPIPAFYLYLKWISPASEVLKNYREIKELYRQTGIAAGFVKTPFPRVLKDIFSHTYLAARNAAKAELLKLKLKLQFPK